MGLVEFIVAICCGAYAVIGWYRLYTEKGYYKK